MAIPNKFQNFIKDWGTGVLNPGTNTFKLLLTNTLPINTQYHYPADFVGELGNGNGYSTGGLTLSGISQTYSAGVETFFVNPVTLTASGGSVGPWRYYVYYDSTTGTLMFWYDFGASVTLTTGQSQTFSVIGNVLFVAS